jgi:hypothetical protein
VTLKFCEERPSGRVVMGATPRRVTRVFVDGLCQVTSDAEQANHRPGKGGILGLNSGVTVTDRPRDNVDALPHLPYVYGHLPSS